MNKHNIISTIYASPYHITSLKEILNTDYPEPEMVIKDILPVGLTVLGGRPKIGKTNMGFQIAIAVATGKSFLGKDVSQGKVLYIALEDNPRRIQKRLRKQGVLESCEINFTTDFPNYKSGGKEALKEIIEKKEYRLIIIDTSTRFFGTVDQMDLIQTSEIGGSLQELVLKFDQAILLIDHHRKQSNDTFNNPIDDLLGSTGKSAPIDTALGIYRTRGKQKATFMIVGREIEEQSFTLNFDKNSLTWEFEKNSDEPDKNSRRGRVYQTMKDLACEKKLITTQNIASRMAESPSNVSIELKELIETGKVRKGERRGNKQIYEIVSD